MDSLSRLFKPESHYRETESKGYRLLPVRFTSLDDECVVVTNLTGEYQLLDRKDLEKLVDGSLEPSTRLYDILKAKSFIYDQDSNSALELLALKYKTKIYRISQFTALHIFVVTLRCDYSCQYCQVSRQTEDRNAFDMSEEIALRSLEMVFKSPSQNIKIEFQGGEPLLNLGLIKFIVRNAKVMNEVHLKNLQFVITTNLSLADDDFISFSKAEGIYISTSLDGPEWLHNKNRPRPGKNGHQLTIEAIQKVQKEIGREHVSALMTTTLKSLDNVHEIIDEYIKLGLHSVFLRPLSPYGFAVKTGHISKYDTAHWVDFYKKGLDYIIELNKSGYRIVEQYTSIILRKMLTPQDPGYVDLQSPSGAAISAIVYNYNADIYASDEARMLAEMGDTTFRLGNLFENSYEEIMLNDTLLDAIESSMTVSVPNCTDCAFLPYCGSDPVYHYATQKDFVGNKSLSGYCDKNMSIFKHIIRLLEEDGDAKDVLLSWI